MSARDDDTWKTRAELAGDEIERLQAEIRRLRVIIRRARRHTYLARIGDSHRRRAIEVLDEGVDEADGR